MGYGNRYSGKFRTHPRIEHLQEGSVKLINMHVLIEEMR